MSKKPTTAVVSLLAVLMAGLLSVAAPAGASIRSDDEMSQQRAGQYYLRVACAGQPAYDRFRRTVFRGRDRISGQEVRRRLPELRRAAGAWAPAIYKEARGLLNPPKAWPEAVASKIDTGTTKLLAMHDAVVAMSNASTAVGYVDHFKRAVKLAGQFPGATIRARLDLPPPGRAAERMGLRDWLRRGTAPDAASDHHAEPQVVSNDVSVTGDEVTFRVSVQVGPDWSSSEPVRMAGTTTEAADECRHMFAYKGLPDGGHFEAPATLVAMGAEGREDPVVAVHVDGARIGFLPGYLAAHVNPDNQPLTGAAAAAQVQMWGARVGDGMRVIGWVAPGAGPVAWPHDAAHPAAVTIEEQRAEAHASTTSMVREALEGDDPRRADQFRRGLVDGTHYLETIEPIKQLKREGKLDEALALCYQAIEGAEADRDGREPAPWYTEQAAIIHRKRGERDEEIAVLRRWVEACPPARRAGSKIHERLDKLTG